MKNCYQAYVVLLVFFFCYCYKAQAQSELIPARIVKAPGDTINGYINFYDTDRSPNEVEFKAELGATMHTYQANEVHSFYLPSKGSWYFSKNIYLNYYSEILTENTNRIARSVSSTFFLHEIQKGNLLSLLMLVDEERKTRYFIQKDSVLSELINYDYSTSRDGNSYTVEVKQYINQLKSLLNDCESLEIRNSLSYTESALKQLLTKYHGCKGETIKQETKAEKPIYNAVINSGIFRRTTLDYLTPTVGIGFKVVLPRHFFNRYFLIQLDQYRYKNQEKGSEHRANGYHLSALAGSYFGKSKIQPFAHAGFHWPSIDSPMTKSYTVGAGVSYAKRINFEIRFPSLAGVMAALNVTFGNTSAKTK
ncbi:hypothetical protein [Adhaeribacter rhizoryzae]|uniref:Uncharacterized protein n=1 Tax=Adhaeribacter rhizoryzae TaxID=2607907 RepID=A0A5M6DSL8_9BACT|nr:hypothetical protein [Adhaeribacter rhizoryzae]KAA5549306.1 hypothetical protein F0145_01545 [Adhaeribacter rhizoryzae]